MKNRNVQKLKAIRPSTLVVGVDIAMTPVIKLKKLYPLLSIKQNEGMECKGIDPAKL